jgi:hypothetical protein
MGAMKTINNSFAQVLRNRARIKPSSIKMKHETGFKF